MSLRTRQHPSRPVLQQCIGMRAPVSRGDGLTSSDHQNSLFRRDPGHCVISGWIATGSVADPIAIGHNGRMVVGERGRVLLVEDEPLVRLSTAQLLQLTGYEVDTASSCAVARTMEGPYEVGIFDIGLPDGCGGELARELLERGAVRRAVFFTGVPESERAKRAAQWGPIVSKGMGPDALVETLTSLLP